MFEDLKEGFEDLESEDKVWAAFPIAGLIITLVEWEEQKQKAMALITFCSHAIYAGIITFGVCFSSNKKSPSNNVPKKPDTGKVQMITPAKSSAFYTKLWKYR